MSRHVSHCPRCASPSPAISGRDDGHGGPATGVPRVSGERASHGDAILLEALCAQLADVRFDQPDSWQQCF
ncbi:hypothetical protein [Noviherbaspirillum pedocola]|uniref:Uncharacterized protein n=1 Tax=Noviherbaspirillum pedocola TaxID=2801341 RepID=A0A934SXF8_9BURK|nr:hypothetical protein [Noviherbaspirillum pedocola]MBK4738330.1 hypothetical protein [Noviherbaspirillum pedocola]